MVLEIVIFLEGDTVFKELGIESLSVLGKGHSKMGSISKMVHLLDVIVRSGAEVCVSDLDHEIKIFSSP